MKTFNNKDEDDIYTEACKLQSDLIQQISRAFWTDMILATLVGVGFGWLLAQWWL